MRPQTSNSDVDRLLPSWVRELERLIEETKKKGTSAATSNKNEKRRLLLSKGAVENDVE